MRERGWATNENQPPVGGYVTYRSLHEHWKRANFVPGGNFHRANTHTHTHTSKHKHAHTKSRERYLCIWIYIYAQKRPSFLGRLGRVSFNDLYILGGGKGGGGGRGRAKTSKDLAAILNGNFLFAATDVEAGCSRPDADGPTRVDRFFNRSIAAGYVTISYPQSGFYQSFYIMPS